jgi:hypothetical protein
MEVDLSAQPGTITVGSIPFVEGVIADISISGLISLASDSRAYPINYSGSLDPAGVGVPYGSCLLDAKLFFSKLVLGSLGGGPSCLIPRTMSDYSTRALIGGTVTATRGPFPVTSNYCDGPCVYSATGSQHISIRPVAGDLNFKGSWSTQSGEALFLPLSTSNPYIMTRFQEFTNPSGLTLMPLLRTWKKADSTLTGNRTNILECPNGNYLANPATYPGLVCDIYVKESGTMSSLARVNGVQHTDTVTVYCVETEPLLNHHKVRQGLLTVLDSSNATNPDPASRSERTFFVLQDTLTPGAAPYIQILPRQPQDNVCAFNLGPHLSLPLPWANRKVLAWGHDHPSEPNIDVPCTSADGTVTDTATTVDVATLEDWKVARNYNDSTKNAGFASKGWLPGPGLLMDLHKLMILRPGQAEGSEAAAGNAFTWDRGLCAWPKVSI